MKIYVTGIGIVSALGIGVDATLTALRESRSGIGPVKYLDTVHRDLPAGEVPASDAELAAMLRAEAPVSRMRTVMIGAIAAREAMADAGLSPDDLRDDVLINGTTVGGMDYTEKHFAEALQDNFESESARNLQYNDCGSATDLMASMCGPFRMVTTTSTACSSAANAMILGANMIKAGLADRVVAGGTEALSRFHFNGFNTLMILSSQPCTPFDSAHCGINLGEGAAYLVLESEESARRRGAKPLAVLSGYGNACDAFHQTATSDNGEGPFLAMSKALKSAGLRPDDISYINTHGTGTPNNDDSELAAIKRIWPDKVPFYSSTKGFTAHTTSASGAIEAVISILALRHSFVPASLRCANPTDPDHAPVMATMFDTKLTHVMNNSFGFGGNDSALIISKAE